MSTSLKWVWGLAVVIVVAFGAYYISKNSQDNSTGPIKVGFIAPLTGDAGSIGVSMQHAVELAVDEQNAAGGISGRPVQVIYEDGKCGKDAANAAQKLVNVDGVKYILGGACSGETLAAAPIAEASRVILFTSVSSSPDITTAGDYIFRNFASDSTSGEKIAQAVNARGYKKVAVIAEQTDYAQAIKKVFETKFQALGGSIVADEGYNTDSKDFRTTLAKIKTSGADALYLIPQSPAAGQILLEQVRAAGIILPKFSNELVTTDSFLKSGVSEGITYAEVDFDQNAPLAKQFFEKFTARFGTLDANTPPVYLASQYDTAKLLFETIAKAGNSADQVKDALYKVSGWQGTAGTVTMDKNGDAVKSYTLKVIKDGKAVTL